MQSLTWRTREYMMAQEMTVPGEHLLVGFSGGADSTCLLFILADLQRELDLSLTAVHVHHGIRRDTADADAAFTEETAKALGIPFLLYRPDVPYLSEKFGWSLEEAGRNARRDAFRSAAEKSGATKTALAHHMEDQAETVLYQLVRGTGLSGLSGMAPASAGIIRPLLFATRSEIENDLLARGVSFREDETNAEDDAVRNKIRHHVLPYLESEIHGGAVRHIAECAGTAASALQYIEEETKTKAALWLQAVPSPFGKGILMDQGMMAEPEIIRVGLIKEAVRMLHASCKDYSRVHFAAIAALFEKPRGKRLDLPGGVIASRLREGILLTHRI